MNIRVIDPITKRPLMLHGDVLTDPTGKEFHRRSGAWRFAEESNYTDNFGFQWNRFEKTQLDRFQAGLRQSSERFFAVTQWNIEELQGKNILEVGSGAGRFSQVVLKETQANLYSVDYSSAVEANYRNNGPDPRLQLFQASIYDLPFEPGQFDKVFCFGVLQHTPDVKKSVEALARMVAPGGELIVDFYPRKGWYTKLHAKYLFRPFTRNMNSEKLLAWIESNVDNLIRISRFFDKWGVGRMLNRFLPICDIRNTLPDELDENSLREWVILDTFDMFSPAYDKPQPLERVKLWFKEFGMSAIVGGTLQYGLHNSVTFVKGKSHPERIPLSSHQVK